MKLDDIITVVAAETDLPKGQVKRVAEKLFETIRQTVEGGGNVSVAGMGSFVLNERAASQRVDKNGVTRDVAAARFMTLRPNRAAMGKPKREKSAPAA